MIKVLKSLIVTLVALTSVAVGVLLLLQECKDRSYVGIYGEDERDR